MENKTTFKDLGLSDEVLAAINKKGFEEPTTIQEMTIPIMLKDKDNIIAQAQTGTGKTAAFALPLIELINPKLRSVQALILAPTRELAIQVSEEITSLCGSSGIQAVPIYGGQSIDQQLRRLKKGVHIVVGTPGRIIDHLKRRTLKLKEIEHLILDEADEMLNMGFIDDIEEIMKHTNDDKRTLLFSATMPKRIRDLAQKYMEGYELLVVKKTPLNTSLTEQIYFEVKLADKFEALSRIIDIEQKFYGLVFCRTRGDVDTVAAKLNSRGYDADAIHGEISQSQRERTLMNFRKKKINILVATDVAARGIDVQDLTHVINYALPQDPEAYIHRIGRTGRAGKQGTAITFITPNEYRRLMTIQRVAKTEIKKASVPQVKDIIEAKRKNIDEKISAAFAKEIGENYHNWAKSLLEDKSPTDVLASLLSFSFDDTLNPRGYNDIYDTARKGRAERQGRDDSGMNQTGKTRLFVALGKDDKFNPKKLVDLISSKVSIESYQISDVQVMDKFAFITVPFTKAEDIVEAFQEQGKRPLVSHVKKSKNDAGARGSSRGSSRGGSRGGDSRGGSRGGYRGKSDNKREGSSRKERRTRD